MAKQSIVLLITSTISFVFGIITTIFTLVIFKLNILTTYSTYPILRFGLYILFIIVIAVFVAVSIRVYQHHLKVKQDREQYNMVRLDNLTQIYNFDYFITL